MGEVVKVGGHEVELVYPPEAGRNDPPMHEWLALPVSEDVCPACGSDSWGTLNVSGYFLVRYCNNGAYLGSRCRARFRSAVTPQLILDVVGALNNQPRRFGQGAPPHAGVAESDTMIVWPTRPEASA